MIGWSHSAISTFTTISYSFYSLYTFTTISYSFYSLYTPTTISYSFYCLYTSTAISYICFRLFPTRNTSNTKARQLGPALRLQSKIRDTKICDPEICDSKICDSLKFVILITSDTLVMRISDTFSPGYVVSVVIQH